MGYGEQSLGQNEKHIYEAHFHGLYYSVAWFALIFFVVLAAGALLFATGTQQWVLLGISAAGLAFGLYQMIPIWTTEIAVTNHRLVVKRGWQPSEPLHLGSCRGIRKPPNKSASRSWR